MAEVALRPIDDADLDALFEQMRDPESVRMAAFTAENPDDRTAFDVHMAKVRTLPEVTTRAVTVDGRLAGSIASFVVMAIPRSHTGSTGPSGGRASPAERSPCSWNRFACGPCLPAPRVTM